MGRFRVKKLTYRLMHSMGKRMSLHPWAICTTDGFWMKMGRGSQGILTCCFIKMVPTSSSQPMRPCTSSSVMVLDMVAVAWRGVLNKFIVNQLQIFPNRLAMTRQREVCLNRMTLTRVCHRKSLILSLRENLSPTPPQKLQANRALTSRVLEVQTAYRMQRMGFGNMYSMNFRLSSETFGRLERSC